MTIKQKLMTADELLALPRGRARHELVRGELRTIPLTTWVADCITSDICGSPGTHVYEHALGEVVVAAGFLLASSPDTVRAPSVGFVSAPRLPADAAFEGYHPGAPDLAVEVISPTDLYTEVDEKVAEWLEHGTRMVLVVNPRQRTVAVHRPGRDVRVLRISDTIVGEDVVPGWTLAVRDLFPGVARPSLPSGCKRLGAAISTTKPGAPSTPRR